MELAKVLTIPLTQNAISASQTTSHGKGGFRDCLARWEAMSPLERKLSEERAERSRKEQEEQFQEELRKNARRGYTSLNEQDWQVTFDGLKVIDQNREAIARLLKWTPELKKGVVLYGPVGTGKSTACKAIINRWASPTYRCLFISLGEAMQALKDAIDNPEKSVSMEEARLVSPNLLVFDDLGAEKSTEWAREKIFTIFEARARQQKHTFFTTNLDPKDVGAVYKERIHDRMIEFCSWVQLPGSSFRKMNFQAEI